MQVSQADVWTSTFLLLLVVPHGATDLLEDTAWQILSAYTASVGLVWVMPQRFHAWLGFVSSAVHFGCDFSEPWVWLGVAVVAWLWVLHRCDLDQAAYRSLCVYMAVWHLPQHYYRVAQALSLGKTIVGVVALTVAAAAVTAVVDRLSVPHRQVRVSIFAACRAVGWQSSQSGFVQKVSLGAVVAHTWLRRS